MRMRMIIDTGRGKSEICKNLDIALIHFSEKIVNLSEIYLAGNTIHDAQYKNFYKIYSAKLEI